MKKIISLILALIIAAGCFMGAVAEEDEDDSEVIPVDITDDEAEAESEIQAARTMQYGDEGEDVLFIQTRLKDLNYYSGNLSGKYLEGTRDAIRRFQEDYGLEADGIADPRTQVVLMTAQYRTLKYGATGDDVKEMQTRLMELGYYKGQIKGNYLEATQKAVERFQKNNGIQATGIADPATQDTLFSYAAVGNYDVPTETPSPIPGLNYYQVNEDENAVALPNEPVYYQKKLKNGMKGTLVKQLQQRLCDLGYLDASKVSGNFQKYTTRAVKALQTQNGLKATGEVDEQTWNLVFNDAYVVLPDMTPKPTATPEPVPFYIVVDVRNQITTVYGRDEWGEYTVPVRYMICSTGKVGTDSDPGDWVLNGRKSTWCYFPKWGGYARYWTRINASIAFHSVIYNAVSTTAIKVSSFNKLGSRASHGCIRLTIEDAKWIYDNVGAGTTVHITRQNDTKADEELKYSLKLPTMSAKMDYCPTRPPATPEPEYRSDVKPELNGRVLREKSDNADVYWMQCRLKELGYYDTKCTGRMLNRTIAALKEFQKDHGLSANGVADQKVIDALYEAATPTPRPAVTSEP
ncbi:MAG: peptidoglycan-binding protein [Clostridiales bacterium]|nr:peptidoglycan-binding protein [Clostridiales bacterium]